MAKDPRTAPITALLAAAAAALLIAGCGAAPNQDAPAGTTVSDDGVAYTVETSRELNPLDPDDRQLIGAPARSKRLTGPDVTLVGVFLQARNDAPGPRRAVAAPTLVDAFGASYRPLRLPAADPFAYRARGLAPGQQIPGAQSVAAESPEGGALLVYRVPTGAFVSDRPFTLRFGTGDRAASVQLDL